MKQQVGKLLLGVSVCKLHNHLAAPVAKSDLALARDATRIFKEYMYLTSARWLINANRSVVVKFISRWTASSKHWMLCHLQQLEMKLNQLREGSQEHAKVLVDVETYQLSISYKSTWCHERHSVPINVRFLLLSLELWPAADQTLPILDQIIAAVEEDVTDNALILQFYNYKQVTQCSK